MKQIKPKDFLTAKIIIYLLLIFLLLLFWTPLAFLIRILAIGYLIYRLLCLIFAGFASIHCWTRILISGLIVIGALALTSKFFLFILILLMALDLYVDYLKLKKDKKKK